MAVYKTAWITTNRTCNCKCSWCYSTNNNQELDITDAKTVVDNLFDLDIKNYVLIGGEPTIYSHLIELCNYIKQKDKNTIHIGLATNGIVLSDVKKCNEIINAGVSSMDISIKATNRISFKTNTGTDGYDDTILGYKNAKKVLNDDVKLSYVMQDGSIEEISSLIKSLDENEIDQIIIKFIKQPIDSNVPVSSIKKLAASIPLICC